MNNMEIRVTACDGEKIEKYLYRAPGNSISQVVIFPACRGPLTSIHSARKSFELEIGTILLDL